MADLFAKPALFGQKPVTLAGVTLSALDLGPITAIAAFPKAAAKLAKKLGGLPAPNQLLEAPLRLWTGPEQVFLVGAAAPDLAGLAAVTDQTGGWAALSVAGPGAEAALMRAYPLDLRAAAFPVGRALRAPLGHMQSVLARRGAEDFLILVFRSMARTAWGEVHEVLEKLAARASAGV